MKNYLIKQSSFDNTKTIRTSGYNIVSQGQDNLYPEYLLDLLNSPTNGSIINTKIYYTIGESLEGNEEFNNLLKQKNLINKLASDLIIFGGYALKIIQSRDRTTIADFDYVPIKGIRFQVDEFGNIVSLLYKEDQTTNKKKPVAYPIYNPTNKEEEPVQIIIYGNYNPYNSPYPHPSYSSAINYIEAEKRLGVFHLNNIKKGFFPSVIVTTSNKFPDEQTEQEFVRNFQKYFVGEENIKALVINSEPNNAGDTRAPSFQTFDVNNNVDIFNNLNETCMQKIITAHNLPSPVLASLPGSGSLGGNANELMIAYELFYNTTIANLQNNILQAINIITKQNNIEETSIINNKPISTSFSESTLVNILTRDELRNMIGYESINEINTISNAK